MAYQYWAKVIEKERGKKGEILDYVPYITQTFDFSLDGEELNVLLVYLFIAESILVYLLFGVWLGK